MEGHEVGRYREVFSGPGTLHAEVGTLGWARFLAADPNLGSHSHPDSWEICYIVRGKVDWWAGDRIYAVGPGDIYLTRPGERHGGVDALMHPCELYWIQVRPGRRREWAAFFARLAATGRRVFKGNATVPDIFERIFQEHRTRAADSPAVSRIWVAALLLEVLRAHDAACQGPDRRESGQPEVSAAVGRALAHLRTHLDEITDSAAREGGMAAAAAAAGLGLSQFHARFRRETGYTPGEYRARLRIERAKQLLRIDGAAGGATITQIAHALGFSTSQYFATKFRRFTGLSPRAYRRGTASAALVARG
jgi:AraC-like DNA-binding protein/mannose-6-phosphate isomerase-like protein (cupin superfamily)